MRCIGLIGGMSYHSTTDYYTGINAAVAAARGGHHSAPLLLSSLDFADVRRFQEAGDWEGAGRLLAGHAALLERAGAEAIVICTNLMHKVAPQVAERVGVPLLHIVDAVAAQARRLGLNSLGILGARWTMTEPFYGDRLAVSGVTPVRASAADVALTDAIIFDELTRGVVTGSSRAALQGVVGRLGEAGADGVLLGCTELPQILDAASSPLPVVDSTLAHVRAAAAFVLGEEPAALPG
ncbi:MAG: amino acid racemase [Propionicimonas sp.]|nr:amino acid racemase [Propionicimonas sp.]